MVIEKKANTFTLLFIGHFVYTEFYIFEIREMKCDIIVYT